MSAERLELLVSGLMAWWPTGGALHGWITIVAQCPGPPVPAPRAAEGSHSESRRAGPVPAFDPRGGVGQKLAPQEHWRLLLQTFRAPFVTLIANA